jgi:hypothetical protein
MRVGIFCPGPSLREGRWDHIDPASFDTSMAVNEAICRFDTEWWVVADKDTFWKWTPKAQPPKIFYSGRDTDLWGSDPLPPNPEAFPPALLNAKRYSWKDVSGARSFSFIAAMALAISMNPKVVEVFGADMKPEFVGGGAWAYGRDPSRFRCELAILGGYLANCKEKNIEFIRHEVEGISCPV